MSNKPENLDNVVFEKPSSDNTESGIPRKTTNSGPCYGARHTQILLLFLLVCIGYCIRVILSVGIVAMTNPSINPDFTTYNWDDSSIILSSFFWGYVLPQVGAGQIAKNFGPRWPLVIAMAVCSLFTALIPVMASLGSYGVMICRVIQGFCQGFFYPCVHNLLSKWVPLAERTRMGTFVYAGGPFGTVIAMPLTGYICASSLGWPSVFYIFGAIGFAWTILYLFLGSNGIGDHKSISEEEKEYIKTSIGHDSECENDTNETPWKSMFTSLPVWSILIAHCGQNWGFWTLLTEIPTYMNDILNFDIKDNGLLSALPYFVLWVLSFVFGGLSDLFINKEWITIGTARKITTSIGLLGPAISLIGLGLLNNPNATTAIALLVVAVGLNSATYCGYQVNHIDLAPKHAGTLMGMTNGAANIFSIIAPLSVQYIVTEEGNPAQWGTVFFIASGVYIVCSMFYTFFGSGALQTWDSSKVVIEDTPEMMVISKDDSNVKKP